MKELRQAYFSLEGRAGWRVWRTGIRVSERRQVRETKRRCRRRQLLQRLVPVVLVLLRLRGVAELMCGLVWREFRFR